MLSATVTLLSLVALTKAMTIPVAHHEASIISDHRSLEIDGQFTSEFKQNDGTEFKEVSDKDGNRIGSYTYIDPHGQKKSLSYTAGVDGFKAVADHLPSVSEIPAPQPIPHQYPLHYYLESHPIGLVAEQDVAQSQQQQGAAYQIHQITPSVSGHEILELETNRRAKYYPPGKLAINQHPNGFSYTFDAVQPIAVQ